MIKDGKIIGEGRNDRENSQDPLSHAETLAIQAAAKNLKSWRLSDCDLVVTLEPCPMCLGAAQQSRLRAVYYGTPDPKGGALSLGYALHEDSRTHHRFTVKKLTTADAESEHLERCGSLLSRFFKERRLSAEK